MYGDLGMRRRRAVGLLFMLMFLGGARVVAQSFEVVPLESASVHNFRLSGANAVIQIDLSRSLEHLAELVADKQTVVYLSLAASSPAVKPVSSWQIFLAGEDEVELIQIQSRNGVFSVSSNTNEPHFLGNLKLLHKDHQSSYAIHRSALASVVRSGGKAYLLFLLNPGSEGEELAKKPVQVRNVRLVVQKPKTQKMERPLVSLDH